MSGGSGMAAAAGLSWYGACTSPGPLGRVHLLSAPLAGLREDDLLCREVRAGRVAGVQPDCLRVLRVTAPPCWLLVGAGGSCSPMTWPSSAKVISIRGRPAVRRCRSRRWYCSRRIMTNGVQGKARQNVTWPSGTGVVRKRGGAEVKELRRANEILKVVPTFFVVELDWPLRRSRSLLPSARI